MDALQFSGYEVLQAKDGTAGLAGALRASVDLLLLDLVLPGPGGFEILQAVKESRPTLPELIGPTAPATAAPPPSQDVATVPKGPGE